MTKFSSARRVLALSLLLMVATARAEVQLPAIFGDHMVLEEGIKLPVWGTADAGEAVSVTLGDKTGKATADASGKWRVDLDPVATSEKGVTLTVAGAKNTVKFEDVLVGDVWVCSGQSNMEFDLAGNLATYKGFGGASNAATAVPAANDPQLRLFIVTKKIALDPQSDCGGVWKVCTPDSAAEFSAVGYFFGQELRKSLHKPIGLIGTYWGGQPAQAFTSLSGLQKDPPFTGYIAVLQKLKDDFAKASQDYPGLLAAYPAEKKAWNVSPEGKAFAAEEKKWQDDTAAAKAVGQPGPPKLRAPAAMPKPPASPSGGPGTGSVLYNGMIAPIVPYGIKGAIWYQGESNAGKAAEYATLFPRMISDWREKWGEGDFPFLFVQLASFQAPQAAPSEGGWAALREAQLKTLSLPKTGMAVAIDIGTATDIHPKDKQDVGLRLAAAAKHVAYGQELVYSGPLYYRMEVEGAKVRLHFTNVGSGLKKGVPPWITAGQTIVPPKDLTPFAIAEADKKFVWAKAVIDGNDVVVSAEGVTAPVAVRYGWANNPKCDLYNKEGFPASPFRTDDWLDGAPTPSASPKAAPVAPKP